MFARLASIVSHPCALPGMVTVVVFVLMNLAKDNAPWPVYIGLAATFLLCTGWTILVHQSDRS
jgi:hypothetical protein